MALTSVRSFGQPIRVIGNVTTVNGHVIADGNLYAGTGLVSGVTGGGEVHTRHLYVSVAGQLHIYDLDTTTFELFRVSADAQPAAKILFTTGPKASPITIIAMDINITTGAIHMIGPLSVDDDIAMAKAGGVRLDGQSTTSGLVNPLTLRAINNSAVVVGQMTFGNTGTITINNSSSLTIPLIISSGYARLDGTCRSAEVSKGTVTTTSTIDWTTANTQVLTMTSGSALTLTFTAPPGVGWLTLRVITAGTIGVITWPATVKWSGGTKLTPATTGGRTGLYRLFFDGTNYWADCTRDMA